LFVPRDGILLLLGKLRPQYFAAQYFAAAAHCARSIPQANGRGKQIFPAFFGALLAVVSKASLCGTRKPGRIPAGNH
jgi:hypothetical protein